MSTPLQSVASIQTSISLFVAEIIKLLPSWITKGAMNQATASVLKRGGVYKAGVLDFQKMPLDENFTV